MLKDEYSADQISYINSQLEGFAPYTDAAKGLNAIYATAEGYV
jgi:hypothetical protein